MYTCTLDLSVLKTDQNQFFSASKNEEMESDSDLTHTTLYLLMR